MQKHRSARSMWRRWRCAHILGMLVVGAVWLTTAVQAVGRRTQTGNQDMYCGVHDCYELLELDSDASQKDVKRAFRRLGLKYHPDKNKSPDAVKMFQAIGTAYEVLSDPQSRKNYDWYIAHPEQHMYNRYRFYQYKARQVPVTPVLAGFVAVVTIIKYVSQRHKHSTFVKHWRNDEDVRRRARREALARLGAAGGGSSENRRKKKGSSHSKASIEAEMQLWMDEMIETGKLDIQGEFGAPQFYDLFVVQLVLLPWSTYKSLRWYWGHRRRVKSGELTSEDREYLTYSALGKNEGWWKMFKGREPQQAEQMLEARLWEGDNMAQFQAQQHEELLRNKSSKMKRYLRYRKKMGR